MDEYGNDDDWTSNYDENQYYSPDEPQQSVATVSGDSNYNLPDTYDEPNTYGYGQTSPIDYGNYNPYEENWQDTLGLTQNSSFVPNSQPGWFNDLISGNGNTLPAQISNPMPQANSIPSQQGGGIASVLSALFSGGSKLLGAGVEGKQNKQKQQELTKIASNPQLDPFGQTQRNFYQEQAQQVVKDPYSSPIVKAQTDELLRQANIRNAAHGRTLYQGGPELVAAQAKIAQEYLNQMLKAGGSQISPDGKTIAGLQSQASNAGINGYASPLASTVGNITQDYQNQTNLNSILNALTSQKGQ